MRYSFLGMFLIMSGVIGIVVLQTFQSITVNNESEYYVLKEAMEAALMESIDEPCSVINAYKYKSSDDSELCGTGILKISEQKFVENFTRRFLNNISGNVQGYTLEFYDIMESPPKATVVIKAKNDDQIFEGVGIVNNLTGILISDVEVKELGEKITNGQAIKPQVVVVPNVTGSYEIIKQDKVTNGNYTWTP